MLKEENEGSKFMQKRLAIAFQGKVHIDFLLTFAVRFVEIRARLIPTYRDKTCKSG